MKSFSSAISTLQLSLDDLFMGSDYQEERDNKRIGEGYKRVFELMKDGKWRNPQQIADLSNTRLDSALRYLRYMKKRGHHYHKRYEGNGLYLYQIIPAFPEV